MVLEEKYDGMMFGDFSDSSYYQSASFPSGAGLVTQSYLTLVTLWTVAHQALCPWDFPGRNTRVGCHFLLQGIFPTQGSNSCLPHCRWILYHLNYQGIYSHTECACHYTATKLVLNKYYYFMCVFVNLMLGRNESC